MEQINTDSKPMVPQGDFVWFYYDEDILYEKLLEVRLIFVTYYSLATLKE